MSDAERGFDASAQLAAGEEVARMRRWCAPTAFVRARRDEVLEGQSEGWPVYRLEVGPRAVLVGRPVHVGKDLTGRCMRGYAAFDLEGEWVGFLKDCWRVGGEDRQEHLVYEQIGACGGREYVATCVAAGDVEGGQETKTHETTVGGGLRHYRMLVRELCRPLTDFANFRELAGIFLSVLRGASPVRA